VVTYDVDTASCGDDAMQLLDTSRYHLVMLDILMPGKTGDELLGEIRTRFPEVAIVVFSMFSHAGLVQKCIRNGADDFIQKPVALTSVELLWQHCVKRNPSFMDEEPYTTELSQAKEALASGHLHVLVGSQPPILSIRSSGKERRVQQVSVPRARSDDATSFHSARSDDESSFCSSASPTAAPERARASAPSMAPPVADPEGIPVAKMGWQIAAPSSRPMAMPILMRAAEAERRPRAADSPPGDADVPWQTGAPEAARSSPGVGSSPPPSTMMPAAR